MRKDSASTCTLHTAHQSHVRGQCIRRCRRCPFHAYLHVLSPTSILGHDGDAYDDLMPCYSLMKYHQYAYISFLWTSGQPSPLQSLYAIVYHRLIVEVAVSIAAATVLQTFAPFLLLSLCTCYSNHAYRSRLAGPCSARHRRGCDSHFHLLSHGFLTLLHEKDLGV